MAKEIEKDKKTTKNTKENKASMAKKTSTKKNTPKVDSKKATKKFPTSKTTKKSTTTKKVTAKHPPSELTNNDNLVSRKDPIVEYYDLPYRYNETLIKLLAQTPSVLFVYWDISENDKAHFIKQYGENFFTDTKPVIVVHNITKKYDFEIEINDFANCWYLNVGDTKCEYYIELGRRPINSSLSIPNNYLYITSSNIIESPNNHILLEKASDIVYFRDVKTGEISSKNVSTISKSKNLGKIYNIYDLYKNIYKNEITNNPTSGLF